MEKKKVNIFFWFMGLMEKRLPVYLAAILVSSVGLAGRAVADSYLVKTIVTAAQTRETEGVLLSVILNFAAIVLTMLVWRAGIIRYNIEAKRGTAKVEKLVFSKVMRLPMSYYEQHHSGDFMSRLVYDTERASDIYRSRFRRLTAAIISAVVYLIPMLWYNVELTLCLLAVSFLSFVVNSRFAGPMKKAGHKASGQNARMTERLTNILAGMETVKIFAAEPGLLRDYNEANTEFSKVQSRTGRLSAALESCNWLFDLWGSLAFLGLGIWFASRGRITLGELTAIYTLYGSFRYVFLDIGKYLPQMMNCVANAEQIYLFLQQEEEEGLLESEERLAAGCGTTPAPAEDAEGPGAAICLSGVSFSYEHSSSESSSNGSSSGESSFNGHSSGEHYSDKKENKVLDNLSLRIEKGCCTAITGESGCGKSTLVKLLLGFYRPDQGSIRIFGHDYEQISLKQVRDQIAYVPQEPYLYEVSIAENIAYGIRNKNSMDEPVGVPMEVSMEVPMEDIINAAKTANAHDFIMKLPEGYNTIPGERGNKLSGGEKQRIAIARAVIRNAPILLLDEATSALDNESERLINEALDRISRDRTTIMIAHRSSTIAMADRVISLT